jgi:[ribosomal protein S5]-alanine N-acetyltransferase
MKIRPTLQTARLILRPFELTDVAEVQKLAGAREIASVTLNVPHPYEDGMAEEWINTHQERFELGRLVNFAIVEKETTRLCGAIGLNINSQKYKAELGYWIGVSYWGQGYCTEAARATIAYGFENFGLHRIHSSHFRRNPASGRVMQKIGMIHEGCLRQDANKSGVFEDRILYGILATEWHELKNR